jgi:hypothetical protein
MKSATWDEGELSKSGAEGDRHVYNNRGLRIVLLSRFHPPYQLTFNPQVTHLRSLQNSYRTPLQIPKQSSTTGTAHYSLKASRSISIDEPNPSFADTATSIYRLSIMERHSNAPTLKEAQEKWELFYPKLSHFENRVSIPPNAERGTSGVIDEEDVEGVWAVCADGRVETRWAVKDRSSTGSAGTQEPECGGFTDVNIDGKPFRKFFGAKGTGFQWLKPRDSLGSEGSRWPPTQQRCIATEARARELGLLLNYRVPEIRTSRGEPYHPLDLDYSSKDFFKPSPESLRLPDDDRTDIVSFVDLTAGIKSGRGKKYEGRDGTEGIWRDDRPDVLGCWNDLSEVQGNAAPVECTQLGIATRARGETWSVFTEKRGGGVDVPNGFWTLSRWDRP